MIFFYIRKGDFLNFRLDHLAHLLLNCHFLDKCGNSRFNRFSDSAATAATGVIATAKTVPLSSRPRV